MLTCLARIPSLSLGLRENMGALNNQNRILGQLIITLYTGSRTLLLRTQTPILRSSKTKTPVCFWLLYLDVAFVSPQSGKQA